MLTLTRARRSAASAGTPLPTVFQSWADKGVHIRQSQMHLFAAAPGVGKSLVSLTLGLKAGVPAYYFSADSDEFTTYVRAAAMLKGWRTQDVESALKAGSVESIDATLNGASHIRFNFNPSPDLDDFDNELNAFAAAYGSYPKLVVMDNLRNLYDPDGGDNNALCEFLKSRARETKAAVIALHHVTGYYDDGTTPVPLSGLIDKISKIPELIVTLNRNPQFENQNGIQTMNTCVVKNRGGRADPSGQWSIPLAAEMGRMSLIDIPKIEVPNEGIYS